MFKAQNSDKATYVGLAMRKEIRRLTRENLKLAKEKWSAIGGQPKKVLRCLTENYRFAIGLGDLLFLDGNWYVTHAGLLRLAARRCCAGITVQQVRESCDPLAARWVFKATVYKKAGSKGFVGHGDADPSNTSSAVRGAEMRVAETRAVSRALRKAYGIGICSLEELSWHFESVNNRSNGHRAAVSDIHSTSNSGQPRLRDKLCVLIRQHNLDPSLVKAYAAEFCGTKVLSQATRESVERFIATLSQAASENRAALICKLNSYAPAQEATS